MEVQIDLVILCGGNWTAGRVETEAVLEWRYAVSATPVPHRLVGGVLQPIDGAELRFLALCGFPQTVRTELVFPAVQAGASPSAQDVAMAQHQWLAGQVAEFEANWNGQVVRSEKLPAEEV